MNGWVTYLLYVIPPMLLGMWAQHRVTSTFRRYGEVPSATGRTGAEIARAILDRNGLTDVPIERVPGEMTDHYDPRTHSVHLSEPVYGSRSVSAVSVAAHEVGHAIQHARSYLPMGIRSMVFPVTSLGSGLWQPLLFGGIIFGMLGLVKVAIALYAFVVLFHIVTLPVEFNASRRAKRQLADLGFGLGSDAGGTSAVLNAAAMTYVAGALAALSMLIYFVSQFLGDE